MIRSENTLTNAFFKSFSERIIHTLYIKVFKQTACEIAPIGAISRLCLFINATYGSAVQ